MKSHYTVVWLRFAGCCFRSLARLPMKTFVAWMLALVVGSPAMFGLNRPFAAELPNDTTAITSLTPEQARLVVAEALPACVLQRHPEKSDRERAAMLANKETAEIYESWATLRLNGLTTLDAKRPRFSPLSREFWTSMACPLLIPKPLGS